MRLPLRRAAVAATVLLALAPAGAATAESHPGPTDTTPAAGHPAATGTTATVGHPVLRHGLLLTVSGTEDSSIRVVGLTCRPKPGGGHPGAPDACDALVRARGDFDALTGNRHACTKQYDPVTATAHGTWRGRTIHWKKTYGNACMLDVGTGAVFRF
ncbi:SSI family serine proteinase inhibitor [Streptomyces sp. CA-294286]|uniref:SSI family serine proteinase inhibitor n=1 Tax=Streptomyces sp. CA-294286 TaxID=3240070 RepID=UPI003D918EC8